MAKPYWDYHHDGYELNIPRHRVSTEEIKRINAQLAGQPVRPPAKEWPTPVLAIIEIPHDLESPKVSSEEDQSGPEAWAYEQRLALLEAYLGEYAVAS